MIYSFNDFADRLRTSYASAHNAKVALAHNARSNGTYSTAIIQRTDGRFAVVIINPDQDSMQYFIHCTSFGVYGVTV